MKVELAKIKHIKATSYETENFHAEILVDGVPVGTVGNEGHGGPNRYFWTSEAAERQLVEHAKSLPPIDAHGMKLDMDLDLLIGELFDAALVRKQIAAWCKKSTLFRLKGDQPDAWRTLKSPFSPGARAWIVGKYGDRLETIANEELAAGRI